MLLDNSNKESSEKGKDYVNASVILILESEAGFDY